MPRVRLITTGGTISNRPGERLSPAELIASVPDLDELVEAQTEEFANVSSNSLTLEQWLHLSRRLNAVFAEGTRTWPASSSPAAPTRSKSSPTSCISPYLDRGADGIVIAGAGAGSTSGGQRDAIAYAYENGVLVVITTRTGGGRTTFATRAGGG